MITGKKWGDRRKEGKSDAKETLFIISQLHEMVRKLGYRLDLDDTTIIANEILRRVKVDDGITKV